jgi:hypothetical protein
MTIPKKPTRSLYARAFDPSNKHWANHSDSNRIFLQVQEAYANDVLNAKGFVFLNDIYDMLGFERTAAGQLIGWFKEEGSNPIVFERIEVSEEATVLDFNPDGVIYDKLTRF